MMTLRLYWPLVALMLALTAQASFAQFDEDSPINLPDLRESDLVIHEIEYPKTLPTKEVAQVDGHVLTQADLLKQLLETNVSIIANTLLMTKMADLELERNKIDISDEEIKEELGDMMNRMSPGQSADDLIKSGAYSRSYLNRVARMQRAWNKLYWKLKNIPDDKRDEQTNQLLKQIFINEVRARYQLALRGRSPAPPKGAIASLNTIVKGKRVSYVISAEEAIEFLVGLLRPATIIDSQRKLIDDYIVRREMDNNGVTVPEAEIESWVQAMMEKYPPPFTWETILKIKGTSPDAERIRWRNVQAWKRATRHQIKNEELDAFRQEHEDFFRSRHVKVAHILVKTTDTLTGLPLSEEEQERGRLKAERIYTLAHEGVEFDKLAKLYSDDAATANGGGALQQPIKKWGGGYAKAFQDVAYGLKKDELSKPVKTQFGYHIILCKELSPPTARRINWNEARYSEWVLEEYETVRADKWLTGLREKSKITSVSDQALLQLKQEAFPDK
ncbi:MAG: peptidylprolyl isomerase [Planctomycetota bacterium]